MTNEELEKELQMEKEAEHAARLKRQKKRKLIILIAVIVVIGLIPFFLFIGYKIERAAEKVVKEERLNEIDIKDYPTGGIIIPNELMAEANGEDLKGVPSDIEGVDKYEKKQMGLYVADGSDTDGDNLTDKEEIEVYKSDPLKCSTAGDLYSDGYKVANGMDVNTYYEYEGDATATDDTGVVTLYAGSPYDLAQESLSQITAKIYTSSGMQVKESTDYTRGIDKGEQPNPDRIHPCFANEYYRSYFVHSFDGKRIDVNLEKVAEAIGEKAKNLDVEIYSRYSDATFTMKTKKGICSIEIEQEDHTEGSPFNTFIIYIIKKDKYDFWGAINLFDTGDAKIISTEEYNSYHGFIITYPWATTFFKKPPKVYISYEATTKEKEYLLQQATKVYQSCFYEPIWVERPVCDDSYLTYTSTATIEKLDRLCSLAIGEKDRMDAEGKGDVYGRVAFARFQNLSDFAGSIIAERARTEEEKKKKEAQFKIADEFMFPNYDSMYNGTGVCLGFARVTAEVYNNGMVQQPRGSASEDDRILEEFSYDVTTSDEYQTLFDRDLSDYHKSRTEMDQFDAIDAEVNKMLTYYWADGNERLYSENDVSAFYIDQSKGEYISWETVQKAKRRLDDHEALICGMCIENSSSQAHAINLVGYESYGKTTLVRGDSTLDVQEQVKFDVYDCNNPQEIGELWCFKCHLDDGRDIMLYEYGPSKHYLSCYMGLNTDVIDPSADQLIMFSILDENLKSLNEKA